MPEALDSDRAVSSKEDDEFGFVGIAESLAPRIVEASSGDGLVIGIEGSWGSGKSSLMNLIRQELVDAAPKNVHTITIAPWLEGDSSTMVMSLLRPMVSILEAMSKEPGNTSLKERALEAGQLIAAYSEKTARWLSPAVEVAGKFLPSAKTAAEVIDLSADVLNKLKGETTVSELKKSIGVKLASLDQCFIVFLDDLDRLEPTQAVEVVRLVRSVADFPHVVYLLCYDREVLANGLKVGLNVEDGDLFLQKIVQLTFQIPLLEPFELRLQFLEGAKAIFMDVNGFSIEKEMLDELKQVVDSAGQHFKTPREVKLTLNTIRFSYSSISDEVHYPDLCWLFLTKTLKHKLYRWLEEYLSDRSIVETGNGSVDKGTLEKFGKRLTEFLEYEGYSSPHSIHGLAKYAPGIGKSEKIDEMVFRAENQEKTNKLIAEKRLASPVHYRYYFALVGSKTVMSDEEIDKLLELAVLDLCAFQEMLISFSSEVGVEKIKQFIFRINAKLVSINELETLEGLIKGITNVMDLVLQNQTIYPMQFVSLDREIESLVESLLYKVGDIDGKQKLGIALWMANEGESINWLVGDFFRAQMYRHGRIGDKSSVPNRLLFKSGELDKIIEAVKSRTSSNDTKENIEDIPNLSAYLYGWRDVTGDEIAMKKWVVEFCRVDKNFLKLLNSLKHRMTSDKVYFPLSRRSVEAFLDWDQTMTRLGSMKNKEHANEVEEILQAIELAQN